ncbi:uncharacterized protein LOC132256869 [Phlebotomus argentipes]|uniref:uncharacterized protein LOC132256869 n=1 Tax=Phlebotomus argentipes TaxID=94469 RepID=UPI0028933608|nr:uncharacterized protein LOC132256869 [Phlebotomus argentipes]
MEPQKKGRIPVTLLSIVTLVLLCAPQHIFGLLMDCERFQSISPPVFFIAIQMIMQPCLGESEDGIIRAFLSTGSLALSFGIIFASVSEIILQEKTLLFSLLYGALGGIGAFLVTTIIRRFLNRFFEENNANLIEVIESTSLALSQLLFPFLVMQMRMFYGADMALLFLGAILLHILPLGLILSHSRLQVQMHNLGRHQSVTPNDLKTPQNGMRRWGNMTGINNHHLADDYELPLKNITSQGVEIMDTIPEEDEGISGKSIDIPDIKLRQFHTRKYYFLFEYCQESRRILSELFVNPFRSIIKRQILFPGVILRACDMLIYTLMVSGLPCLVTGEKYRLSLVESSILLSLMALPIILIALTSAWMEDVLCEKSKYWHISGEISKLVGCIIITSSHTIFFLRMGVLCLGAGQGLFIILQERIIREIVDEDNWRLTRSHISAVSGYLLLILGFFTNHLIAIVEFSTIFLVTGLFYSAAIFSFILTTYF